MKPNPKCIKAVLIYVQDNISPSKKYVTLEELTVDLTHFTNDEIVDTLRKLENEEIFTVFIMDDLDLVGRYGDLTSKGHSLAESLRNTTIMKNLLKAGISTIPEIIKFIPLA